MRQTAYSALQPSVMVSLDARNANHQMRIPVTDDPHGSESYCAFLDGAPKEKVIQFIDEGVRILSNRCGEEGARIGGAYSKRSMAE